MSRRQAGVTLVEVAAGVTILGIVIALVVPAMARSSRFKKILVCQGHLRTLYEANLRGPMPGPKEYGRAYWSRLTLTTPPLVTPDVLRCPFVEAPEAPPCQYFGPAGDVTKLEAKDPLGCDMEISHSEDGKEGGNVLLKSGEVVTDHTGIWLTAIRVGKCRP
jgi:hypothetical protein